MTGQELTGTDEHAASAGLKERVALSSTAASAGITVAKLVAGLLSGFVGPAIGSGPRIGRYSRHDHDLPGYPNRKQARG